MNVNQNNFTNLPNAISLKQVLGEDYSMENIFKQLCQTLENRYLELRSGNFNSMKQMYLSNLYWYNSQHFFKTKIELIEGKIINVLRNGYLQIQLINGQLCEFDIKDIEFVK